MKISTKGRYALRIMLDLAMSGGKGPVSVKDIARRQDISTKYMEQIVTTLCKAGYLKSIRGPQGGYLLAKAPRDYTVGMILRITEGSLAPVACLDVGPDSCPRSAFCATLRLWKELDEAIAGVVDKYTLEDLVQWQLSMGDCYVI